MKRIVIFVMGIIFLLGGCWPKGPVSPICSIPGTVVDVTQFGARGDGVTDDTAAIQSAIDAVSAQGGGTVFFPEGTYLVSQAENKAWCLELHSDICYVGLGYESKIILQAEQGKWARMMSTGITHSYKNIIIKGLHLDGNKANQNQAYEQQIAIFLAGVEDCQVIHCIIHDFVGDAIYVHQGILPSSQRVLVQENEIYGLFRVGVNFEGTSHSIARSNFIHDMENNALKMEEDAMNSRHIFSNNRFVRNLIINAGGLSLSSSINAEISDIIIEENSFEAVKGPAINMAEVTRVNVIGNNITKNINSAILIRSSKDVMVKNNTIALATATEGWDAAIKTYSAISPIYWFSWGDVPGNDSDQLLIHLRDTLKIDWVENAIIVKTNNGKAIAVTKGNNSLILKLNEPENKVILEIDSGTTYTFVLKNENGKLNVYTQLLPPNTNIRIEGNKLLFNKMAGIRIRRSEDCSIVKNVISGNQVTNGIIPSGIDVWVKSKNNFIERNIVEYNQGYGIRIHDGSASNRIRRNFIHANSLGGIWAYKDAGLDNDFGTLNDPGNNCIYGNSNFGFKNEASVIEAIGNYWGCPTGPGQPDCDTVSNGVNVIPVLQSCQK